MNFKTRPAAEQCSMTGLLTMVDGGKELWLSGAQFHCRNRKRKLDLQRGEGLNAGECNAMELPRNRGNEHLLLGFITTREVIDKF